jgi:hypothetical protein
MTLPIPVRFVLEEGGEWRPWEQRTVFNRPPEGLRMHTVEFDDGSQFDMLNGWRIGWRPHTLPQQAKETLPKPSKEKEGMKDLGLIYLASPYSKYPLGLEKAFQHVSAIAGAMLKRGALVYSPIAHTHPIAKFAHIDPYALDVWLPFDEAIMNVCDTLVIATMRGWPESKGIAHEIEFFRTQAKPIYLMDPFTLELEEYLG